MRETDGMSLADGLAHERERYPGFAPDYEERVARFSQEIARSLANRPGHRHRRTETRQDGRVLARPARHQNQDIVGARHQRNEHRPRP